MAKKHLPTVYLDTTIFSMLHFRGNDIQCIYRQLKTKEWWDFESPHFRLLTSKITELELTNGVYRYQEAACAEVKRIEYLPATTTVQHCADTYSSQGIVPLAKENDASQLAFATIYEVDYLLSWNYAHMANPEVQRKMEMLNRKHQWHSALLVTPESIPQIRLGQNVKRRSNDETC